MTEDIAGCSIRRLRPEDEQSFLMAVERWTGARSAPFAPGYEPTLAFGAYLDLLGAQEKGQALPPSLVPFTVLFGFIGSIIVGRITLRHRLNARFDRVGGHIGYSVLPEYRKRGVARSMLTQTLPRARALGLGRVLLTCDDDNIGSYKVIERCGGVLENKIEVDTDFGPRLKRRYWIAL